MELSNMRRLWSCPLDLGIPLLIPALFFQDGLALELAFRVNRGLAVKMRSIRVHGLGLSGGGAG
jgi:hypothetical protein